MVVVVVVVAANNVGAALVSIPGVLACLVPELGHETISKISNCC